MQHQFEVTELFTNDEGRAAFREIRLPFDLGSDVARLTEICPANGIQFRRSPVGFKSDFHCSPKPQWVFILSGTMEIGLQDGSSRVFERGSHFLSADTLPAGATFDKAIHGHWSRQVGAEPLVTLFVKTDQLSASREP
ncbi:MAG: hypothetical protein ABIW85_09830 [Variovorax sp.]